jgi:hypothetical protein
MYLTTLFLTGLRYPRLAVGFSSVWLVGRVLYTTGEHLEPRSRQIFPASQRHFQTDALYALAPPNLIQAMLPVTPLAESPAPW